MANKGLITKNSITGFHNSIVFIIVIVTFIGSSLLFWQVNTSVLRKAIEAETSLMAALLEDDILLEVPDEKTLQEKPEKELSDVLATVSDQLKESKDNDFDVWIVDRKTKILAGSGVQSEGKTMEEALGDGAANITIGKLRDISRKESHVFWEGPEDFILLSQKCCVVRPIYDGDLFIVVRNTENDAIGTQRRQFALLMSLELFLLLIMIVLIMNNNARYEKVFLRMATTDELTGLANRKSFNSTFAEYMEKNADRSSVFLLDIDYFKKINDNYGHAAGDSALKFLGKELGEMAERTSGIAGRWGGDEFIGVLPLTEDQAMTELEDLGRMVREHETAEGFKMSVSIGVAPAQGETSISRLTEKADIALYNAKGTGKDKVCKWSDCVGAEQNLVPVEKPQASDVESAVNAANEMTISKQPEHARQVSASMDAGSLAAIGSEAGPRKKTFSKRIRSYIREKLIMSTILGVRWMAPFIAGGGILIALAFLFDSMSVDLSAMSVTERAQLGSITPIASTLKEIGTISFNFMLPVFAGFMAYGIAGEAAFMAGFVGGYMTIESNAGFAGAMVAGLAAGILVNEMTLFNNMMPDWMKKAAPIIIYPVFNLIIMKVLTSVIITPIASAVGGVFTTFLEDAVAQSHVAGGALAAMMMATDMGGIINKVGYNFGVGSIAVGNTDLMAAVMIGGMVPPIGLFLSTILFKDKFSEAEKDWGLGTFCMGLSFITEGALPYVFTDVIRVIPSCMAGSAVAGLLSVVFGCKLPAPHGGIFVFPIITNPVLYAIALLAGSLVTAVILGLLKKRNNSNGDSANR